MTDMTDFELEVLNYFEILINRLELFVLLMIFNTVIFLYYVIRRQR